MCIFAPILFNYLFLFNYFEHNLMGKIVSGGARIPWAFAHG